MDVFVLKNWSWRMMARNHSVIPLSWTCVVLGALALGCAPDDSPQDLEDSEESAEGHDFELTNQEALQHSFDNAACYCEKLLLEGNGTGSASVPGISIWDAACDWDGLLFSYAEKRSDPDSFQYACDWALPYPNEAPIPLLPTPDPLAVHACTNSVAQGFNSPTTSDENAYSGGFCRAEFNYCLAQQLRMKADSFARPPTSDGVRDSILLEARIRFQTAAAEWAGTLSRNLTGCNSMVAIISARCGEIDEEYAQRALTKLSDALLQSDEVLRDEIAGLLARSDLVTPGTDAVDYYNKVWSASGLRIAAARRLAGNGTGTPFASTQIVHDDSARQTLEVFDRLSLPFAYLGLQAGGAFLADADGPGVDTLAADVLQHFEADIQLTQAPWECVEPALPAGTTSVTPESINFPRTPYANTPQATTCGRPYSPGHSLVKAIYGLDKRSISQGVALLSGLTRNLQTPVQYVPLANWTITSPETGEIFPVSVGAPRVNWDAVRQIDPREFLPIWWPHATRVAPGNGDLGGDYPNLVYSGYRMVRFPGGRPNWCEPTLSPGYGFDAWEQDQTLRETAPSMFLVARKNLLARGAMGNMALIRAWLRYLQRLQDPTDESLYEPGQTDPIDENDLPAWFTSSEAVGDVNGAIEIIDRLIGKTLLEYREDYDLGAGYHVDASITLQDDDLPAGGQFYLANAFGQARCLLQGGTHVNYTGPCDAPRKMGTGLLQTIGGRVPHRIRTFREDDYGNSLQNIGPFLQLLLWNPHRPAGDGRELDPARWQLVGAVQSGRGDMVFPLGGEYMRLLGRVLAHDVKNPALPMYNSLDLASELVPPLEHELIDDGDQLEDSWRHYLDQAKTAATQAKTSLDRARQAEVDLLQGQRVVESLYEQAEVEARAEVTELCGVGQGACDIAYAGPISLLDLGILDSVVAKDGDTWQRLVDPRQDQPQEEQCKAFLEKFLEDPPGVPTVTDCNHLRVLNEHGPKDSFKSWKTCQFGGALNNKGDKTRLQDFVNWMLRPALECSTYVALDQISTFQAEHIPQVVRDELRRGDEGQGDFSQQSGAVRTSFINMYRALDDIRNELGHMKALSAAGTVTLDMTDAFLDFYAQEGWEQALCMFVAIGEAADSIYQSSKNSGSSSSGRNYARIENSWEGTNDKVSKVGNECGNQSSYEKTQKGLAGTVDTVGQILSMVTLASKRMAAYRWEEANLANIVESAGMAGTKAEARKALARAKDVTNNPAWRALQSFDARRARRAMRTAQKKAFVARRAIETRLGIDMRLLTAEEALVPAPQSWVQDIFTAHTKTSGQEMPGSVPIIAAGEAIADYVDHLEDFVFGYPFARRYAEGEDTVMLSLAELLPATGTVGSDGEFIPDGAPFFRQLEFKCQGYNQLLRAGALPSADGTPADLSTLSVAFEPCTDPANANRRTAVEYALAPFALPQPFGGYLASQLSVGNYNYRIRRVGANVVGTSVRDCERSSAPTNCNIEGNMRFSMTHDGYVPIESYEGEYRYWSMERGIIERARALAAERVLTNPLSSTDRGLIEPYLRSEWWGRPLGGSFGLMLMGSPEIDWRRIEDLQVLLNYTYWTRQR